MQIVERPAETIVGIVVVASFAELAVVVPQAWARVFACRSDLCADPDDGCVEVSAELGHGDYREILGVVVETLPASLPDGWSVDTVPAGRYLHHRHQGDESSIGDTFGDMYRWAESEDLRPGPHKVDVGYRPDHVGPHDLYLELI